MDTAIERTLYRRVGYTLLIGLLISIAVMIAGLLAIPITGGHACVLPLARVLSHLGHGGGSCSAGGEQLGNQGGTAAAILDLGILLLFATPLAGVIAAAIGFALERDWVFTGTAVLLLAMLLVSFAIALH